MSYRSSGSWNPDMLSEPDPIIEIVKESLLSPEFIDALAKAILDKFMNTPITSIDQNITSEIL